MQQRALTISSAVSAQSLNKRTTLERPDLYICVTAFKFHFHLTDLDEIWYWGFRHEVDENCALLGYYAEGLRILVLLTID